MIDKVSVKKLVAKLENRDNEIDDHSCFASTPNGDVFVKVQPGCTYIRTNRDGVNVSWLGSNYDAVIYLCSLRINLESVRFASDSVEERPKKRKYVKVNR